MEEITIYDRGIEKRVPPHVLQLVLLDDIAISLREIEKYQEKISESLKREEFIGKLDPRTLSATDELRYIDLINDYPYMPWVTAHFRNDGPGAVYLALNEADRWHKLNVAGELSVDFLKADERIVIIFYKCDPGQTASIRVLGKY